VQQDQEHAYDDLIEELAATKIENGRLVEEVTKLRTELSDMSYGKLESERPVTPSAGLSDGTLASLLTLTSTDALAALIAKLRDSPESIGNDITLLQQQGRIEDAKQLAELAIKTTPGNVALHMRWVRQVRYSKDFDLGLAMCDAAFKVDGDGHLQRLNRGYLLFEAGRYEEAAGDFDVAACTENPIEERLAAAAARLKLGRSSPAEQTSIINEHFDPAKATFQAKNLDKAAVQTSLQRFGCAWIKGLFDHETLENFDKTISRNIKDVEKVYLSLGLPEHFNVGFPLYFAAEKSPERAQGIFKSSYPNMFDPARMEGADNSKLAAYVFKQMKSTGLDDAVRSYLKMDKLYSSAAICHIRSFTPPGMKWFGEFHQDNRLYNSDAEILTLWFPFRYKHGPMPSLEFLPLKSKSHLPCTSVCGIDNTMFVPEAFWRPEYELGDAMLLSGFVPHRTYIEKDMDMERISIDFRLFASQVPDPIYESAGGDRGRSGRSLLRFWQ
jgi:tetratricopeptide (TPR) repeat protein